MQRQPVQSSNLISVGYDTDSATLEIEFRGGGLYRYAGVPKPIYSQLLEARSKGRFFQDAVRGHFEGLRVSGDMALAEKQVRARPPGPDKGPQLNVADAWIASQKAHLRLQLDVIGKTHQLLGHTYREMRSALLEHANSEGKLDGLGLYRTKHAFDSLWNNFLKDWKAMFEQARLDAASYPFGVWATFHDQWVAPVARQAAVLGEAQHLMPPPGFTELGEVDLDFPYVFDVQPQVIMDAAENEILGNMRLSNRLWKLDQTSLDGIQGVLMNGVANQSSAWDIAKQLEPFLGANSDCPRWTRTRLYGLTKEDIADGDPTGLMTGDECTGQGVAYNALRLARTEIARVHSDATDAVMQTMPWIEQEEIHLSPDHAKRDVCDDNVGTFPKGEKVLPFHPQCLCFKTAVQQDHKSFTQDLKKWLDGTKNWPAMDDYARRVGGAQGLTSALKVTGVNALSSALGLAQSTVPQLIQAVGRQEITSMLSAPYLDATGVRVVDTTYAKEIDASIGGVVQRVNDLGYATLQSMSGVREDYALALDRFHPDGYLSFTVDRAKAEQVMAAAKESGLWAGPQKLFFTTPTTTVRVGMLMDGTPYEQALLDANATANKLVKDKSANFEEWMAARDKALKGMIDDAGGFDEAGTMKRWNLFVANLETEAGGEVSAEGDLLSKVGPGPTPGNPNRNTNIFQWENENVHKRIDDFNNRAMREDMGLATDAFRRMLRNQGDPTAGIVEYLDKLAANLTDPRHVARYTQTLTSADLDVLSAVSTGYVNMTLDTDAQFAARQVVLQLSRQYPEGTLTAIDDLKKALGIQVTPPLPPPPIIPPIPPTPPGWTAVSGFPPVGQGVMVTAQTTAKEFGDMTGAELRDAIFKREAEVAAERDALWKQADLITDKAAALLSPYENEIGDIRAGVPEAVLKQIHEYEEEAKRLIEEEYHLARHYRDQIIDTMLPVTNPLPIELGSAPNVPMSDKFVGSVTDAANSVSKLVSRDMFLDGEEPLVIQVEQRSALRSRAYARPGELPNGGFIFLTETDSPSTMVHEMGHLLESDPDIKRAANDFLDSRTQGEVPKWLGDSYDKDEIAKADRFKNPYVGKIYSDKYTEVVSMGLEYYFEDPLAFMAADPEYFDFIVDLVRGHLK